MACPLISIVIPAYNLAGWIQGALESVLSQDFTCFECLCIDDGSTDGTGRIIDEFAMRDPRIVPVHQANRGEGGARNAGIERARGQWILFLDGDDILSSNALSRLVAFVKDVPGYDMYRFGYMSIPEECNAVETQVSRSDFKVLDLSCEIPPDECEVYAWQFLYDKAFVSSRRFRDHVIGADRVFIAECLHSIRELPSVGDVLYGYRQRSTSAVHTAVTPRKLYDTFRFMVDVLRVFDDDTRDVGYCRIAWLQRFLAHDYVVHISRVEDAEARSWLWGQWFSNVEFLSSHKMFSGALRVALVLSKFSKSRIVTYLVCGVGLALGWRLGLSAFVALNPRAKYL